MFAYIELSNKFHMICNEYHGVLLFICILYCLYIANPILPPILNKNNSILSMTCYFFSKAIEVNGTENEQISSLTFITVVPLRKWIKKKCFHVVFYPIRYVWMNERINAIIHSINQTNILLQNRLQSISIAIYLLRLRRIYRFVCDIYLQWTFFLLH